jgi:hypothetical protein
MGRLFQPSRSAGGHYSIWWVSYYDRSQRREIRESSGSRSRQVALKLLAQREAEAAARPIPRPTPDAARRAPSMAPAAVRAAVPGFVGAVVIVAAVVVMIPVLGWVAWFPRAQDAAVVRPARRNPPA